MANETNQVVSAIMFYVTTRLCYYITEQPLMCHFYKYACCATPIKSARGRPVFTNQKALGHEMPKPTQFLLACPDKYSHPPVRSKPKGKSVEGAPTCQGYYTMSGGWLNGHKGLRGAEHFPTQLGQAIA
eukprot:510843-Pyramimonas_sp.AAC.1